MGNNLFKEVLLVAATVFLGGIFMCSGVLAGEKLRTADAAFNAGEYGEAWTLYTRARESAAARGATLEEAEIINSMAAVQLLIGSPDLLLRHRKLADKMKRDYFFSGEGGGKQNTLDVVRPGNLLGNGGFESGLAPPWGGGHYERAKGSFRFGIWWNSGGARAFMKIDHAVRYTGQRSLRISNLSKSAPHVFTTTSQRINGLKPNTVYRVSMYVKARDLKPGAVALTVDAAWAKRLPAVPAGSYDWKPYSALVNIGHNDYIDLRIIHQNTGTVWLDDISVVPAIASKTSSLNDAEALYDQGRYIKALALVADLGRTQANNGSLLAGVHRLGGRIYVALGRYDKALSSFTWLVDKGHGRAHLDLGNVHMELGQYDDAVTHYLRALEVVKGDQGSVGLVLERLGRAYFEKAQLINSEAARLQQVTLAAGVFKRGRQILSHIGDAHGEVRVLQGMAALKRLSGQYLAATDLISTALDRVGTLGDRKLRSDLLLDLADTQLLSGTDVPELNKIKEALALKQEILDRMGIVRAHHLTARVALGKGQDGQALQSFKRAIDVIDNIRVGLTALSGESRRRFTKRFKAIYLGYLDTAYRVWLRNRDSGKALKKISFDIGQWAMMSSTAGALAQMAARFGAGDDELARRVRMRQDGARTVQALNKRLISLYSRPRSVANMAAERLLRKTLDEAVVGLNEIDGHLRKTFPEYFSLASPSPISLGQVQELLGEDEALVFFLDGGDITSGAAPLGLFVWVVTKDDYRWVRLKISSAKLLQEVRELRIGLDQFAAADLGIYVAGPDDDGEGLPFLVDKSHQLYRVLFSQYEDLVRGKKHLLLIPSGPLTALPFQVLATNKPDVALPDYVGYGRTDWLIKRHAMTVLPSVSSLKALRARAFQKTHRGHPFMGFGNPLLLGPGGDDRSAFLRQSCALPAAVAAVSSVPRARAPLNVQSMFEGGIGKVDALRRQYPLPETANELCAVAKLSGASNDMVHLGAKATETRVKELSREGALGDVRIVHFATHGLLAGEAQEFLKTDAEPALMLTPPDKADEEDDGLLTASEVAQLKLNADWVVMSACNTAGGDHIGAETLSGLARAFFYAGARALLVSHWYVNSRSTVALITKTFNQLEKHPEIGRSEALRRAMLELILAGGAGAHPANWAPFVVVGEGG